MPDDLPDIRVRGDELIGESALKDLLVIGDSQRLEEAQKRIDNHISRQSLAIENRAMGRNTVRSRCQISEQGTRWALATFSWDNFAGKFYRAEIVKTFDTLKQASTWSTERERAALENRAEKAFGNLPDPVEEIVAEMQMAGHEAKSKLDRGMVVELTDRTNDLGMER
jgi:hypothetical protein